MRVKLTAAAIEAFRPSGDFPIEKPDANVVGLRLVIQPSGHKSWAVRYRHEGRNKKLTLGPWPRIGLQQARELAAKALRKTAEGEDPAEEKREKRRKALTRADDLVETIFQKYRERHLATLRPSTRKEIVRLFQKRILPKWRKRLIGDIGKRDVNAVLDDMVSSGAPVSANRLLTALKTFFRWCVSRDILAVSPCAEMESPTEENSRERVLRNEELRWLWRACTEVGWPFGPIVRLLILTGARREEVAGLRERELRIAERLWSLPGTRTKNCKPHDVHLAGAALAILESVPRVPNEAGYVFSTNGRTAPSGFSRAKVRFNALMLSYAKTENPKAEIEPWVLHDLRRTMATRMAGVPLKVPPHVIEACLNHISESKGGVAGIYNRAQYVEEKEAAFDAWALRVKAIIGENVVSFPQAV